jgi:CDP-ribitol ribitolphosphotransferase
MYNNILLDKAFTLDSEMYSDFFIDVSDEKDIEDLMIVSDVLVTDYSSVIFDYYLLDRPLVFFAYDINEYSDGRGWYYPIEEYMYGPLARTQKELIYAIRNSAYDEEKRNVFGKKFMDACDGHSTEKTCDWIFGDMKA